MCWFLTLLRCFLHCGDNNCSISAELRRSAYLWCRQTAYSQQRKSSISSLMISKPMSHLIHPMGEKAIQILKLASGRYPFWTGHVCLFSKEQREKEKQVFAVLSHEESYSPNWAREYLRLLLVCQH